MSKEQNNEEGKDIITYTPAIAKAIKDKKTARYFHESNYYLIIKLLSAGPKTVKEITKEYNKEAKKTDLYEPKSNKSIYRYLGQLEKAGLVVPAGQRIVLGKTAAETLYSRTAHVFLVQPEMLPSYKDIDEKIAGLIAKAMKYVVGKEANEDCIKRFLKTFDNALDQEYERLIDVADKEVLQRFANQDWEEIKRTYSLISYFGLLLNRPDIVEKLRKCLKEE